MPKLSSSLSLFNAEFRKAWSFPILELAVGLVALISISSIQTLQQIVAQPNFEATFNSLVVNSLSATMNSQLLLLGLLCGILVSLSFTRDYEQGLTQTLLSWPISRSSLFVVKLVVVVLPLALLSWILTSAIVVLNFYGTMSTTLAVLGASAWIFPVTLLALMFYGGVATVVALVVKRTIPTVLSVALIGFFVWFITTMKADIIGNLAQYLVLTPFQAPLITLGKILGVTYQSNTLEAILPSWSFLLLTVFYALLFLIPMYLYFTRRFELRE